MKKQRCSFTISIEIMFCLWTGVAFGQPFPEKPTARLGVGIVEKIAYSPDGKLLALAHNVIWLYDANNLLERTGQKLDARLLHQSCPSASRCWHGASTARQQAPWNRIHLPYIGPGYSRSPERLFAIAQNFSEHGDLHGMINLCVHAQSLLLDGKRRLHFGAPDPVVVGSVPIQFCTTSSAVSVVRKHPGFVLAPPLTIRMSCTVQFQIFCKVNPELEIPCKSTKALVDSSS